MKTAPRGFPLGRSPSAPLRGLHGDHPGPGLAVFAQQGSTRRRARVLIPVSRRLYLPERHVSTVGHAHGRGNGISGCALCRSFRRFPSRFYAAELPPAACPSGWLDAAAARRRTSPGPAVRRRSRFSQWAGPLWWPVSKTLLALATGQVSGQQVRTLSRWDPEVLGRLANPGCTQAWERHD